MLHVGGHFESLKAAFKDVPSRGVTPFGWNRFYSLPQYINVQGLQNILKIQQRLGWNLTVNAPIKITGSAKVSIAGSAIVSAQVRRGTTEEVSVINEMGIQPTFTVFHKEGLPVVHLVCDDIDQPCQPEADLVTDPLEHGTGQDFKEPLAILSQEPRAEAQAGSWTKTPLRCLYPAVRILVQEGIGDLQGFPLGNGQPACAIKLASGAFVEEQV